MRTERCKWVPGFRGFPPWTWGLGAQGPLKAYLAGSTQSTGSSTLDTWGSRYHEGSRAGPGVCVSNQFPDGARLWQSGEWVPPGSLSSGGAGWRQWPSPSTWQIGMGTLTPPGLPKTAQQTLRTTQKKLVHFSLCGVPCSISEGSQEATSLSVEGLKPLFFADLLQSIYFWP